jgi:hypothetical protein
MTPPGSTPQSFFDPELGTPAWRDSGGVPAATWARVQQCFIAVRGRPRDSWHGAIDQWFGQDRRAGYEVLSLLIADEAAQSRSSEVPEILTTPKDCLPSATAPSA